MKAHGLHLGDHVTVQGPGGRKVSLQLQGVSNDQALLGYVALTNATFARINPGLVDAQVSGTIKQGISSENAKKITKLIRDEGPKGVKTQIQGDEVRVSSKKRDDLQSVISMLKGADLDVALQFVNYR